MLKRLFLSFSGLLAVMIVAGCCSIPPYSPGYWNDSGTVQHSNNCYNYGNNKRTDTFAQPGRAAGSMYTSMACTNVFNAAVADGLEPLPATGKCKDSQDKVALVVWPGHDFHWYRQDSSQKWSHKPGQTRATNLDNSGHQITNPETADRGPYTAFCGYLCSCSDKKQGQGHEHIN